MHFTYVYIQYIFLILHPKKLVLVCIVCYTKIRFKLYRENTLFHNNKHVI